MVKGVRDIDTNGKLRKLNAPEKRRLAVTKSFDHFGKQRHCVQTLKCKPSTVVKEHKWRCTVMLRD